MRAHRAPGRPRRRTGRGGTWPGPRHALAIIATALLVPLAPQPAAGVPGRDPAPHHSSFTIFVAGRNDIDTRFAINGTAFDRFDGWDFGDRAAYSCAWVEYYEVPAVPDVSGPKGAELFEIHFQRVRGVDWTQINDKYGLERRGRNDKLRCGKGWGDYPRLDGSDHFPHGTSMSFMRDGRPLVTLDLHNDECASGYWTPGDQPGEAWLWWDEDGPTNNGHHELDCGGGPLDPVPVVRAWVRHEAAGVGVCSEDMLDGDRCDRKPGHSFETTMSMSVPQAIAARLAWARQTGRPTRLH